MNNISNKELENALKRYFQRKINKIVTKIFRNRVRIKGFIMSLTILLTGLLFHISRSEAIAIRGNGYAFGGEVFILLIPLLVWFLFKNIKLQRLIKTERPEYKENGIRFTNLKVEGIKYLS